MRKTIVAWRIEGCVSNGFADPVANKDIWQCDNLRTPKDLNMTQTVSVDEAKNKLPDLLADALAGNEVIITEHGTPVARLIPVVAHSKKSVLRVLIEEPSPPAKILMNPYRISFGWARNEASARHSHLHLVGRPARKTFTRRAFRFGR
jgi:prevent-host-death family protein